MRMRQKRRLEMLNWRRGENNERIGEIRVKEEERIDS